MLVLTFAVITVVAATMIRDRKTEASLLTLALLLIASTIMMAGGFIYCLITAFAAGVEAFVDTAKSRVKQDWVMVSGVVDLARETENQRSRRRHRNVESIKRENAA